MKLLCTDLPRLTRVAVILVLLSSYWSASVAQASTTISLPTPFDSGYLLQSQFPERDAEESSMSIGATAIMSNNVGSIWDISSKDQPKKNFTDASAYANSQMSGRASVSYQRWHFGFGRGDEQFYNGNADAAQLWIDLHTVDGLSRSSYAPVLQNVNTNTSWYGVGYALPFHRGDLSGTVDLFVRRLSSSYELRLLSGNVEHADSEDSYTGMAKLVTSDTPTGETLGQGWSVDVQAHCSLGKYWEGLASIDGVAGRIAWQGLYVESGYVTSPHVYTDPDGYFEDAGGISGAQWHQSLTARPKIRGRLDTIYKGCPNLLFGAGNDPAGGTSLNFGMAWPQRKLWTPFVRYYPAHGCLELGAAGRNWQVGIQGNDWIFASPKSAQLMMTVSPVRF